MNTTKQLQLEIIRAGATIANVIQDMERELKRMREKKVSEEYIAAKDDQIQTIVNYYNQVEELSAAYKLALANARIENHFLTEMLLNKLSVDEVMNYKPSLKVQLINEQTVESITVTELNG